MRLSTAAALLCFLFTAPARAHPSPPALTREAHTQRDWTVRAEVRLHPAQPRVLDPRHLPPSPRFFLSGAEFLYPALASTAGHDADPAAIRGLVRATGPRNLERPRILTGYQGLSSIALWESGPVADAGVISFLIEIDASCYETRIDERAARRRAWPAGDWGPDLDLCLQPQLFVEADDPAIIELARRWAGAPPRDLAPYDLAKRLAAGAIDHFRVTDGLVVSTARGPLAGSNTASLFSGFNVAGAAAAARAAQGSPYDLACLYTAACRAAGLPARLVIGLDIDATQRFGGRPVVRAWTEFFLPDPPPAAQGQRPAPLSPEHGQWIPVDITRQKEFSSRPPPLDRRWQHFGHNEELDFVVPLAFHWLPPEESTNAGPPGLWGWRPLPGNPAADTELKFDFTTTPRRGGPPARRDR